MKSDLTIRERAAIMVLLFIVKLINPTTYTHEVGKLKDDLEQLLSGGKENGNA